MAVCLCDSAMFSGSARKLGPVWSPSLDLLKTEVGEFVNLLQKLELIQSSSASA